MAKYETFAVNFLEGDLKWAPTIPSSNFLKGLLVSISLRVPCFPSAIPGFGTVNLSDFKTGSTKLRRSSGACLLSLNSKLPAFTSTQLLVAKLLGFLLSISAYPRDIDSLFQGPV